MIPVNELKTFEEQDMLLSVNDLSQTYRRRATEVKPAVMWGQRKLGCAIIQFLTLYWDKTTHPKPILVYAGAAPGNTIVTAATLFPEVTFELYDPKRFNLRITPSNVIIHTGDQGYFTDDTANQWSNNTQGVYFISDIRTVDYSKKAVTAKEKSYNEQIVWKDMLNQQRWYQLINPVKAQLKMRLPYYDEETSTEYSRYVPYLYGLVYKGIWSPQTSSETRLVPEDGIIIKWDIKAYEEKMAYFNAVIREQPNRYVTPVATETAGIEPGFIGDYDSTAEIAMWVNYLKKIGGDEAVTADNVVGLVNLLTRDINHSYKENDWLSVSKLRQNPYLIHELRVKRVYTDDIEEGEL